MLQLRPYRYSAWWLPHDAEHETFATQLSVIDQFLAAGAPARKVPNPDKGIFATVVINCFAVGATLAGVTKAVNSPEHIEAISKDNSEGHH